MNEISRITLHCRPEKTAVLEKNHAAMRASRGKKKKGKKIIARERIGRDRGCARRES